MSTVILFGVIQGMNVLNERQGRPRAQEGSKNNKEEQGTKGTKSGKRTTNKKVEETKS